MKFTIDPICHQRVDRPAGSPLRDLGADRRRLADRRDERPLLGILWQ